MSDSHYDSAILNLMDKGMSKKDAEIYLQLQLLNIIKENQNNPLLQENSFDIIRCKLAHKTKQ